MTMVHDGGAALAEFDKLHPDLVLLDVMMPVMDGWEVCRKIRAKDNTPIIMLTAKGETYDKVLVLSWARMTTSSSRLTPRRSRPASRPCCAVPPPRRRKTRRLRL